MKFILSMGFSLFTLVILFNHTIPKVLEPDPKPFFLYDILLKDWVMILNLIVWSAFLFELIALTGICELFSRFRKHVNNMENYVFLHMGQSWTQLC